MKIIKVFILICFANTTIYSQRDFDYTIYTSKYSEIKQPAKISSDTFGVIKNANFYRKFSKSGNVLTETSLFEDAEEISYSIKYAGTVKGVLMYTISAINGFPQKQMYVFINPLTPTVEFDLSTVLSYYK